MLQTKLYWADGGSRVELTLDDQVVADVSLEQWANLSATERCVSDAIAAASEAARREHLEALRPPHLRVAGGVPE